MPFVLKVKSCRRKKKKQRPLKNGSVNKELLRNRSRAMILSRRGSIKSFQDNLMSAARAQANCSRHRI